MLARRSAMLLMGASLLLGACGQGGKTEVKVIRIGAVGGAGGKNSSTTNMRVAEAKHFFDEEFAKDGIKVQVIYFAGTGPAMNEAFAQNQLDFAEYGGLPNVIGLAGGAPTRMLIARHTAGTYYAAAATGPGRPKIERIEDLKGHKIAVQMGTMPHLLLIRLLEQHGLKEGDVQVVNLQSAEANAAFVAGAVDAVWGATATLGLRDKGKAVIIGSTKDLPPQAMNLGGFLVRRGFEADHPDLTQRVVKAAVKTYDWASRDQNRNELLQLYAMSGLPLSYYEQEYVPPMRQRFSPLIDGSIVEGYRQIARFALDKKLIRKLPDFADWYEPKYQKQAIKDLGLEGYWTPVDALPGVAAGQ